MITNAISKLVAGDRLSEEEAMGVTLEILGGGATQAQIASFLTALAIRGATEDVLVGMAKAMKSSAVKLVTSVRGRLVDICGTGGDNSSTFNVSTAAAIIAAGSGAVVAKHGNRAASSKCGSADVLEMLGVNITAGPDVVRKCVEEVGIGFLFAPVFHPAMKAVASVRREMRIRTVFNLLGPLTNPANVKSQVVGVHEEGLAEVMARVLVRLGAESALVVHGSGLDEVAVTGPTTVVKVAGGGLERFVVTPEEIGAKTHDLSKLVVDSAKRSAELMFRLLYAPEEVERAIVDFALCNAAAALTVAGITTELRDGYELARDALYSGRSYEKLKGLVRCSGGDPGVLEAMEVAVR